MQIRVRKICSVVVLILTLYRYIHKTFIKITYELWIIFIAIVKKLEYYSKRRMLSVYSHYKPCIKRIVLTFILFIKKKKIEQ
ncbi:hypothetical protein PUN28_005578 [Cardiocondyla obscurior]|uniref:Secreted protein n=1 Tax=Cardiocondyla obscurior TaxID=286306 RepID=A0AAW2GJI4_9HYME